MAFWGGFWCADGIFKSIWPSGQICATRTRSRHFIQDRGRWYFYVDSGGNVAFLGGFWCAEGIFYQIWPSPDLKSHFPDQNVIIFVCLERLLFISSPLRTDKWHSCRGSSVSRSLLNNFSRSYVARTVQNLLSTGSSNVRNSTLDNFEIKMNNSIHKEVCSEMLYRLKYPICSLESIKSVLSK